MRIKQDGMGSLPPEILGEDLVSELYTSLGFTRSGERERDSETPQPQVSTLVERAVQRNEKLLKETGKKEAVTIFHGVRAPNLSIGQDTERIFKFFNNAYYARVGGISTKEMNRLELTFLFGLDFRLQVTVESFGMFCEQMKKEAMAAAAAGGGEYQIERPILVCRLKGWSSKEESKGQQQAMQRYSRGAV